VVNADHSRRCQRRLIVRYGNTVGSRTRHRDGTEGDRADWSYSKRETTMRQPTTPEIGEQVPARPHDSGSAANETVDGLDATTEALRHATEDRPSAENLAGYHANQKARHNHRNASRSAASGTRPVSPAVADHKHRSRSTDPWWFLVRVFPRLAKLQKKAAEHLHSAARRVRKLNV
jgi:hypothetical protein